VTTAARLASPLRRWHDLEQRADRSAWTLYAAELLGTALLLVGGLSAVIFVVSPASPVATLALPGWLARGIAGALFGLTGTLVTLSAFGRHSGAHLNPAMTLAFLVEGRISASHAAWYVVSQLLGAIAGAAAVLVWGPVGTPLRYGATTPAPGLTPWLAVGLEALCTTVLVGTVFVFLGNTRLRRFTAWTMGPMYALMVSLEAPWTGTSTNPARSLGPAVVTGTWQGFWIYLVGPALGAAAGVGLARVLGHGERRVDQARIARHPTDPPTGSREAVLSRRSGESRPGSASRRP
jgi:aquaporin Z